MRMDMSCMRARAKERHMAKIIRVSFAAAGILSALATSAYAHTGVDATVGFAPGFLHPLTGLDHLAAMIAVGLLAVRMGGRALWALPLMFVSFMGLGGAFGMAGITMPLVEMVIMLSAAIFALLVLVPKRFSLALATALTGFFAFAHGMAHGIEMPENAVGLLYATGFAITTATLHGAGMAIGFALGVGAPKPALDKA
jgi:urease accessory protein